MSETLRIVSPADGSIYAERPVAGSDQALAAVERAAAARQGWRGTPLDERLRILTAAVECFTAEREAIAEELAWSMGRPVAQGGGEVRGFEERARYMLEIAPRALADVDPGEKPGFRRFIRREPVGVVLTIAPWNFPYMTAVNSIWPALAAGNTVLLKPARQTALCGERLERVLTAAGLPTDVFQCVHMSHDAAAAAMRDEAVRLICFTGSVAGGRAVQRAVGEARGFPATGLELGGKDPAYVRADADITAAAAGIADGAMFNAGQSCCSVERVYVHEAVYDEFVDALVSEVRALHLGNPLDPDTTLGPLVSAGAAEPVRDQVAEAIAAGARALIDPAEFPAQTGEGPYLAPQVLVDVTHRMRVMTEETFGPVAGVMRARGDEEAVTLMNDSEFGLSASVWTRDLEAAQRIGERLETGTVFLNRSDYLDPALAWTGVRQTGRGCTLSVFGYEHVTRPKSFHMKLA
ncbi:MAG: aldehyde dehydrogenase family protein [Gammaproteobacteria bacterium]|nr:aldehyde dehydrogenase family protein [Gammaproteobacteria bacterium]NIR84130.1 aldehyde dehydrogenase family protein [Gammaproteobacteria bacterium]NIR89442.1 aldehyde dehydrogenase family protein [Gammaproteobacteria bacterium]NIU05285.1 aldehyde dehydrogenase family protein [Gammaproteobacteria bacterium]NIV52225.1 aldehyde dehydrogenase family protein [Gammaproteobacteria bacterium]